MKTRQNILFRFSGGKAKGKELGMGHVYRCLNLARCLKRHNLYFLIEDFGGVEKIIREADFTNIIRLKKNADIDQDVKKLIKLVNQYNIEKIIVDKYKIKLNYLKKIRNHAKLIVISDLNKTDFPGDLVINGFIGLKNELRKNKYGVTTLTGVKYQILNEKFAKIKKAQKKYELITSFGGFDEHGISNIVIKEIKKLKPNIKVKIILGPATQKINELSPTTKRYITVLGETNDMQKEMSTAKIGLCAGGMTTYEFASQKIPFGIICQEKHQLITAREWEKRKIAVNLGLINENTSQKLEKFLLNIISRKFEGSKKRICDGKGASRVAKKIITL